MYSDWYVTYPDEFKLTKITPVYKNKERKLTSNYRPVAVLTNLYKLFESIFFDRINSFFFSTKIEFFHRTSMDLERNVALS